MKTIKTARAALSTMLLALLSLASVPLPAALLGSYTFEDAAGEFTASVDTAIDGLSLTSWSDAADSLTDFAGNPGRAIAARDWDAGNEFHFEISVPAEGTLDIDGFSFDNLASSSGATAWSLSIDEIAVGSGATTTSFSTVMRALDLSGLSGTFWVRLAGSGASSGSGTWRIDNFQLTGTLHASPVPLPPALGLLAPALVGLLGLRRRTPA